MTKALPHDSGNFPLNLFSGERNVLGKVAFRKGIPMSELIRRLTRLGLAITDPEAAKEMARVRREKTKRRVKAMACVGLSALMLFAGSERRTMRTARGGRGGRRNEYAIELDLEAA